MNYKLVLNLLGRLQVIVGVTMIFPLLWALFKGEQVILSFLASIAITVGIGLALALYVKPRGEIRYKDGFALVTFTWLLAALFGTLPYMFSGAFTSFADAFFESMSGFTTTGASVMTDIEGNYESILLWRALTHWLGGMGIVVLFVALLSQLGIGAMRIFKAEVPGPTTEKIKPRVSETARILLTIYMSLTAIQMIVLLLLGLSFFDAVTQTFGTVATGGFSSKNASIGAFDPAVQWVITLFMFLAGTNFVLFYRFVRGDKLNAFWKNAEFKMYTGIILTVSAIIYLNIPAGTFNSVEEKIRHILFQVVSITTTTGFATVDYDLWPIFPKTLLIGLMFVGGCVGSTSGGLKVGRHLVLIKQTLLELNRIVHPRAVLSLNISGRTVKQETILAIFQFFFLYMFVFLITSIYMATLGFDWTTSFTSVAASIGSVGPGFALVGPAESFAFLPATAKFVHSFLMLLGRLELYTVLVLILPKFWRD